MIKISYVLIIEGKIKEYSGDFRSITKAKKWYEKHGKWLEKTFNRKLFLCEAKCENDRQTSRTSDVWIGNDLFSELED